MGIAVADEDLHEVVQHAHVVCNKNGENIHVGVVNEKTSRTINVQILHIAILLKFLLLTK